MIRTFAYKKTERLFNREAVKGVREYRTDSWGDAASDGPAGAKPSKRFLPHTPSSNVAADLGLLRLAPAGGDGFAGDLLVLVFGYWGDSRRRNHRFKDLPSVSWLEATVWLGPGQWERKTRLSSSVSPDYSFARADGYADLHAILMQILTPISCCATLIMSPYGLVRNVP
jgi:hypothetical protein